MSDTTNAGGNFIRNYLCNAGLHPDLVERLIAALDTIEDTDPLRQLLDRRWVAAVQSLGALKDTLYDIEHESPHAPGGV